MKCKECGCDHKTKYMIRVDKDPKDPEAKAHYESTTKKSIVGWIKHIVDVYPFDDITIYNLNEQCTEHKKRKVALMNLLKPNPDCLN